MADNKLDLLENKLTRLELRIFGNADKDVLYPKVFESVDYRFYLPLTYLL